MIRIQWKSSCALPLVQRTFRRNFTYSYSINQNHLYPRFLSIRNSKTPKTSIIGILREDQSVWEGRAPLSPRQVHDLIEQGNHILIQPSARRAYSDHHYQEAGAHVQKDLSEASLLIGVKQPSINTLLPNKTYCFFSHTTKGQSANMPLLEAILDKKIRLLDYEKMVDDKGRRLVAFGKYAGVSGMLNILHGLGLRLLAFGYRTPFIHISPPHSYPSIACAAKAVREAGKNITNGSIPKSLGPLTFVFTGSGNVSQGAQSIFRELPHEYVLPEDLPLVSSKGDTNKVYGCQVSREHYLLKDNCLNDKNVENKGQGRGAGFLKSSFAEKIAPHTRVLVNGIYWALNSPRLLTLSDVENPNIFHGDTENGVPNLLAVCDISADPGGSMEFVEECTTIDRPFRVYDVMRKKQEINLKAPGILYCSIDNMPTQFPLEASDYFGERLFLFLPEILRLSQQPSFQPERWSNAVRGAIVTSNGELTKNFGYIEQFMGRSTSSYSRNKPYQKRKKVLVVGAGRVSEPLVEYLSRKNDKEHGRKVEITLVSGVKSEVDGIANKYEGVTPLCLDVIEKEGSLQELLKGRDFDAVVSLLPPPLHPHVAMACIQHKVNLIIPSYFSPPLQALEAKAKDAGIILMTEVGLDPGIDHLLAMECFDEVHSKGGQVDSFISYCGGLPAPECITRDNPLLYKFSWSPRGVLLTALNDAKYLKNGEIVEIPLGGAILDTVQPVDFFPALNLEGFPNRDCLGYKERYGLHEEEAMTFLRGTLRFRGYGEGMKALLKLGLIDPTSGKILKILGTDGEKGKDITWRQLIIKLVEQNKLKHDKEVLNTVQALGLLNSNAVDKKESPLDNLSNFLASHLAFDEGERDMVILYHQISINWKRTEDLDQVSGGNANKREVREISMVNFGDPYGYSAMAKTVGYTAAIATNLLLSGEVEGVGNVYPFRRKIYEPLLRALRTEGIRSVTKSTLLSDVCE